MTEMPGWGRSAGEAAGWSAGSADSGSDLGWALHGLAVAMQELDIVIARGIGLSALEYLAVKHLMVTLEPAGPVELGRRLGISSGSASELAERLVTRGHLHRQPHPVDRRRRILLVTTATRDAVLDGLAPALAGTARAVDGLDAAQQAMIARFLNRLSEDYHRHLDHTLAAATTTATDIRTETPT